MSAEQYNGRRISSLIASVVILLVHTSSCTDFDVIESSSLTLNCGTSPPAANLLVFWAYTPNHDPISRQIGRRLTNGTVALDLDGNKYSIDGSSVSLTIQDIESKDAGSYQCSDLLVTIQVLHVITVSGKSDEQPFSSGGSKDATEEFNGVNPEAPVYAEVKPKNKRQKDKSLETAAPVYAEVKPKNKRQEDTSPEVEGVEYAEVRKPSQVKSERTRSTAVPALGQPQTTGNVNLVYADLDLKPASSKTKIKRVEPATDYSTIDFDKKAPEQVQETQEGTEYANMGYK